MRHYLHSFRYLTLAARFSLGAIAFVSVGAPAAAGQPIESSFFPSPHLNLETRWLVPQPKLETDAAEARTVLAQSGVTELRFTIPAGLVGKRVRIFLQMPMNIPGMGAPGAFRVEWASHDAYRAGSARAGDRVLFFEGTPDSTTLRGLVDYTFTIDASLMTGEVRFDPGYEIEEY